MAGQIAALVAVNGSHESLEDVAEKGEVTNGTQEPGQLTHAYKEAREEQERYGHCGHDEYGQLHGEQGTANDANEVTNERGQHAHAPAHGESG